MAKLSGLILGILFVVIIITQKSLFIYTLLQWLPVAAFPLLVAKTLWRRRARATSMMILKSLSFYKKRARSQAQFILIHILFILRFACFRGSRKRQRAFWLLRCGCWLNCTATVAAEARSEVPLPCGCLLFCLAVGIGFAGHIQISQFQMTATVADICHAQRFGNWRS